MKSEAQNQLAAMAQIGNTELAKEMGLPAPEDIEISDFDMENLTKKENGYWEAKVVFVSEQKGKQDRKVAARVLLIETEGQWRVARMARL